MATSGDGRAPYKSSSSKRPFQSEIHEEPQNVSQEAGRINSSGISETHQARSAAATRMSKLEQVLKLMSFTRSETQYLIKLLHSRTIEEAPSDNLGALRQDLKLANNNAICLSKTPMPSPQHPATLENLPSDILPNIFIRLFAKQLAQMRCVSKSWNALLSEPSFIKAHLHYHSTQKKDNPLLHFSQHSRGFETFLETPNLKLTKSIKLPIRTRSQRDSDLIVIGSVNGLICSSYDHSVIHIWNPSLSAVLSLPPYSIPCNGYEWIRVFFRFGFDPKTDDYKVVKLTSFADPDDSNVVIWWMDVEVYSMRKGSWNLTPERVPSHITWIDEHEVLCVDGPNGHLHWLGCMDENTDAKTIVAFDLGSEKFNEMRLPSCVEVIENHRYKSLGVVVGKLCVMVWNEDNACEVWVMKKYGVAESWVKCCIFSHSVGEAYPFGFTSSNKFLIQDRWHLVLHNPFTKQAQILKDGFSYEEYSAGKFVEYVDSLVWVHLPSMTRWMVFEKGEIERYQVYIIILHIHVSIV